MDGPRRVRAHSGHTLAQQGFRKIEAHEAAELKEVGERELVLVLHLRERPPHGLHERPTVPQSPLHKSKLASHDVIAVLYPGGKEWGVQRGGQAEAPPDRAAHCLK